MSLTTQLRIALTATLTGTPDLSTPSDELAYSKLVTMLTGTGLDQADLVWSDTRTLGATTSENIDLAGALTGNFGQTITFARVKLILIKLKTLTAGYKLEIGGAASNTFLNWIKDATDIVIVRAGGLLLLVAPDLTAYAVTAASGDILKINNPNAGSVDYEIVVIGASL